MKPVFASLKDADGLSKVRVPRRPPNLAGTKPPESSGNGAEKEQVNSKHLASKLVTVSSAAMNGVDKSSDGKVALFGRKQNVIQPVLKNTVVSGASTNTIQSALRCDSPTKIGGKSKLGEVKIKSNLRDGTGRSSFKMLGVEKQVSFELR